MKLLKVLKNLLFAFFLCCFLFRTVYSQPKSHKILGQANGSDVIIIGTVQNILDTPGPRSEMFHSMVRIHVDSLLKGNINFGEIIIRLKGGPITNAPIEGTRIVWSDEPELTIGKQYVLFLKKPKNSSYLNSPFVKKKYKSFDNKKSITDLSNYTFWLGNRHVFKIENNKVFYFDTTIDKVVFIKIIGGSK